MKNDQSGDESGAGLSQERQVLDTIINNIPAMVFYKDLDGRYIAANEMFCRQMNTTPQEIIGKTDFDLESMGMAHRYRETDMEIIRTGLPIEGFEEEIMIGGESRVFTTRKVPLIGSEGKPYGIVGLSYDITTSFRAEQELIESRTSYKYMYNMFRLMSDNIPDLLWAKDLRKRYLFANKAICDRLLCASDTDEPIGKTDMLFAERQRNLRPDDPEWHTFGEICADTDDIIMRSKAPGRFDESGNVRGEFMFLDVHKAPIMDEDGNMIGTVGSGRDITRQKLMEQEFQSLYQRNRAIIDALPDLMFLFDQEATYLEVYSSNYAELLVPPSEIIGKKVRDFFGEELHRKTLDAITGCLNRESIQTFEYESSLDGKPQYYEARLIRVDENKALCISRNITIQRMLQQELVEARDIAEESSRLKTTLLNNMSHEIRTPLNGILGFSNIMVNEIREKEFSEMASQINNAGKRLMKTLDSIMQLSQLESGTKANHSDAIHLPAYFSQLMAGYRNAAAARGLTLELHQVPDSNGYLDMFFFNQALSNILENAIKFTHRGGVTIDVSVTPQKNTRVLAVTVEDTGIGIQEEHSKIIFDEFRQASEGQNRDFDGTGLGLTIAVRMIRLLGGEITVQSQVGSGSVFRITLPFPDQPGVFPAETPFGRLHQKQVQPDLAHGEGPVILLVEDDLVNARLIQVYLRDNYRVDWVSDPRSALENLSRFRYDVVLMDINLGDTLDGIQTSQIIRQMNAYHDLPIIALTGYTMYGDRERLIESGCTDYLAKPVTRTEILEMLRKVLQEKK